MTPSAAARLIESRGVTLISFDLDDTLVDTDGAAPVRVDAIVRRALEVIERVDRDLLEHARERALAADPVVQGRLAVFLEALGVDAQGGAARAMREAYNGILPDVLEWVEGAPELLARLRGRYRLGVVTNGPSEIQRPKIDKFGIAGLVDVIVISGEVGVHKPDAAIFKHLLRTAGVPAAAAAHVGDSLHADVAGARAAGMGAIWFPPRRRPPEQLAEGDPEPDAVLESLADL